MEHKAYAPSVAPVPAKQVSIKTVLPAEECSRQEIKAAQARVEGRQSVAARAIETILQQKAMDVIPHKSGLSMDEQTQANLFDLIVGRATPSNNVGEAANESRATQLQKEQNEALRIFHQTNVVNEIDSQPAASAVDHKESQKLPTAEIEARVQKPLDTPLPGDWPFTLKAAALEYLGVIDLIEKNNQDKEVYKKNYETIKSEFKQYTKEERKIKMKNLVEESNRLKQLVEEEKEEIRRVEELIQVTLKFTQQQLDMLNTFLERHGYLSQQDFFKLPGAAKK